MALETLNNNLVRSIKPKFKHIALVLSICIVLFSCLSPGSKDEYLAKFEKFVERVEKNHKNYTEKDWKWADATFSKFSNLWYQEYQNKLTTSEELEVVALKLKYQSCKQPDVLEQIYKDLIKDSSAEIKEKINLYMEEDFTEDVDQLIKGLKEIGDSAINVVNDVVRKIDNRF